VINLIFMYMSDGSQTRKMLEMKFIPRSIFLKQLGGNVINYC